MTSVIFESSGYSTIAPVVAKVTVSGLGAEARCIVCHQFRASKASVDGYITTTRAAGLGTGPSDVVDCCRIKQEPAIIWALALYSTARRSRSAMSIAARSMTTSLPMWTAMTPALPVMTSTPLSPDPQVRNLPYRRNRHCSSQKYPHEWLAGRL